MQHDTRNGRPSSRARSSRRSFLKAGGLAAAAFSINTRHSLAMLADEPASPFTTPWLQPLRFANYAVPLPSWQPLDPLIEPERHQRYAEFAPRYLYDFNICEAMLCPHPQLAYSPMSTFCGCAPGPTFMMRYGTPALVRMRNSLPASMQGFGSCDVITHVHNGHHPSESDGFPGDHYEPGHYRDFHYPNMCAGNDAREAKSTLWYHDHAMDFTSQNVHRGLAGFYLLFNERDSGDERDANPDAYRLPSGVPDGRRLRNRYDIPLAIKDARFDASGRLTMDTLNMDGILGDKYMVNGGVQPYFEVERRKYRFRLLDACTSRFLDLWMSNGMEFQQIGNDGNLLPAPVTANRVKLGPAERADIVVDFATLPEGTREIYLVDRAEHRDARGPTGNVLPMAQAPKVLKFVVRPETGVPDLSRVPAQLKPLPEMDLPVARERTWHFDRTNGLWTVNGRLADVNRVDAEVKLGTAEIWTISTAGGWAHPIHMHLEEYRILSYNDKPVTGSVLGGVKDVFSLYPGDEMRIYMKFRDWVGRYVMHCHNTVHEDHAMMVRWDVVP